MFLVLASIPDADIEYRDSIISSVRENREIALIFQTFINFQKQVFRTYDII